MYNIYTAAGLLWLDGVAQSPSEAVPFNLREGPGVGSLWHFGRRFSGKAFAFWMYRGMGVPPWTLLEFQTVSLRLEIKPFWMFVAHSLTPLNCCW